MLRPLLLIASRHSAVASALHQYIDLLFPNDHLGHRTEHLGFSSSSELFEKLDGYTPEQLRETILVFDLGAENGSPWEVSNMRFERGLVAQLVMSYPEIYFVFLCKPDPHHSLPFISDSDPDNGSLGEILCKHHFVRADHPHELIELIQHHARGFRAIFDATGLRSLIKQRLLNEVGGSESKIYDPLLSSRQEHAAAVVDEESAFVYLNGYVAYQAGFRSWLIGTWSEFKRLLMRQPPTGENHANSPKSLTRVTGPSAFKVVLSDWDLAFPDLPGEAIDTDLLLTDRLFADDERIILITSFNNESQQALLSKQNGFREVKPYGGMFKLLACTPEQGENPIKDRYNKAWAGILEDQASMGVWAKIRSFFSNLRSRTGPNSAVATTETKGSAEIGNKKTRPGKLSHHSAPHARSVVANRLLSRAKQFKQDDLSTEDAVHMALLAGEAKEILGGMSRTTAYDALSTQNEAEVSAEVSFLGMSARVEVMQRLSKLKQEAKVVQNIQSGGNLTHCENQFALRESEVAHLNFLLQAVKKLRLRFTEHEQMEASEECLSTFAEFHYKLIPWQVRPLQFLRKVFEFYLIKATKSGTSVLQLLIYCCGWILLFGVLYSALLLFHSGFMKQTDGTLPADGKVVAFRPNSFGPQSGSGSYGSNLAADNSFARWLANLKRPWNCLAVGQWHSLLTFLELQPGLPEVDQLKLEQSHDRSYLSMEWMLGYRLAVVLELIVAYFHLGLLVSVLYRHITMRSP